MTIPKILHQIWLGPRPEPLAWTRTWREMNPDFEYRLWTDDAIDRMGLRNDDVYRRFVCGDIYDGAADVARAEILLRYGGVYVDADSVALRPLADAPFMGAGFFAQREPNESDPELVTNAFMGAVPGHPILARYVAVHAGIEELRPMWMVSGPGALTKVLATETRNDVMILPWDTFFTASLSGDENGATGQSYAEHYWSTTAERWGYDRATPYPSAVDDSGT
jgi:mannosyltransferase OCH1-like enzyme